MKNESNSTYDKFTQKVDLLVQFAITETIRIIDATDSADNETKSWLKSKPYMVRSISRYIAAVMQWTISQNIAEDEINYSFRDQFAIELLNSLVPRSDIGVPLIAIQRSCVSDIQTLEYFIERYRQSPESGNHMDIHEGWFLSAVGIHLDEMPMRLAVMLVGVIPGMPDKLLPVLRA